MRLAQICDALFFSLPPVSFREISLVSSLSFVKLRMTRNITLLSRLHEQGNIRRFAMIEVVLPNTFMWIKKNANIIS